MALKRQFEPSREPASLSTGPISEADERADLGHPFSAAEIHVQPHD